MSTYPTAYRGGSASADAGGFPTGLAALGGFLAPAAQAALAAVEPPIRAAAPQIAAAVQAASRSVPTSALGGLRGAAGAVGGGPAGIVIALALETAMRGYELYRRSWLMNINNGSWTKVKDCGGSPQMASQFLGFTGCQVKIPLDNSKVGVVNSNAGSYFTWEYVGGPVGTLYPNHQNWKSVAEWHKNTIGAVVAPTFNFRGLPTEWPALEVAPRIDPLSWPPGRMAPPPFAMPWRAIPARQPNPERAPNEQSGRGYTSPSSFARPRPRFRSWPRVRPEIDLVPFVWPKYSPGPSVAPSPLLPRREAPDAPQSPSRRALPRVPLFPRVAPEVLPGAPAKQHPAVRLAPTRSAQGSPELATQSPIRQEAVPGAYGPTIIIGGGPPAGPQVIAPPGPGVKERKSRFLAPGASLLIRKMVNPVTEAIDALDCIFDSLPKDVKWKVQKDDWARQRAEAKSAGKQLSKKPGQQVDTRGVAVPLDAIGLGGQSITLPGTGRKAPPIADLNAHHIQPLSPQAKAAAVYRHAEQIDVDEALKCMIADQAEDRLFGALGRKTQAASKRLGLPVGLQTGPVF